MVELKPGLAELSRRVAHRDRLLPIPKTGARMRWRFQAYRDLLQRLGHGDGMAEVMEVATRDFIDAAKASGDPRQYLITRSRSQNIVVDELDMLNLPVRGATLYIVGAFQQQEGFLKDLVDEIDGVRGIVSRNRNSGESALDWALEVLPGGKTRNIRRIGSERYLSLEYYRGIRNAFMHPSKSAASLEASYRRAAEFRELYVRDFGLQAPNPSTALTLADFLLFTRVIKYVATDLCRIAEPTHDEIEGYAERQFASDRKVRRWSWHTISIEKAETKVVKYFKRHDYDISSAPELVQRIVRTQFAKAGRT